MFLTFYCSICSLYSAYVRYLIFLNFKSVERYYLFHIFVTIIIVLQVCRRRVVGTTVITTLPIAQLHSCSATAKCGHWTSKLRFWISRPPPQSSKLLVSSGFRDSLGYSSLINYYLPYRLFVDYLFSFLSNNSVCRSGDGQNCIRNPAAKRLENQSHRH